MLANKDKGTSVGFTNRSLITHKEIELWEHFREVIFAANRMRDNYSEGDEAVKRRLRTNLYTAADAAREFYEDNKKYYERPEEDEYNQVRY